MAVTKIKAYNSETAIDNSLRYVEDKKKTSILRNREVDNALEYSEDAEKTTLIEEDGSEDILVSGHRCIPETASDMIKRTADIYHRNGHNENIGKRYEKKILLRAKLDSNGQPILDNAGNMIHDEKSPVYHDENGDTITFTQTKTNQVRTSYMWVMAFAPEEICGIKMDPRLIHKIGKEFMDELEKETGLQFPAVISTHMDRHHIHNHIVMSAYALDGHHKYVDTMQTLMKAREISDRLSLKYDLPIIMEPDQGHSMSYKEWKLAKEGKSWKDDIKQQIVYTLENSGSYADFLKKMQEAGFKVRETENHLTYYYPGNKHRCRDVGLGNDYTKDSIQQYFNGPTLEQQVQRDITYAQAPQDPTLADEKPIRLSVARYTADGRRRSDLEMLLLKAIKLIQYFKDRYSDIDTSDNPIRKSANWKTNKLSQAIIDLNNLGIGSLAELDQRLDDIGAKYSHAKKDTSELSQGKDALKQLSDMLDNLKDLQTIMDSLGISDPCIQKVLEKDIAKNRAKIFPMSPSQRRDLYLALQDHPLYKLNTKYEELTYTEAKAAISFLLRTGQDKTIDSPPACLSSALDTQPQNLSAKYQAIADKYIQALQSKYAQIPASDKLKSVLDSLNLPIDIDTISMADGIHLAAYYKDWNPQFKPCQNPDEQVSKGKAAEITEMLKYLQKDINIPVDQLSKQDANGLLRDLALSQVPPAQEKEWINQEWQTQLSGLSIENREYAEEYRDLVQQLIGLGYDLSDVDTLAAEVRGQLKGIEESEKIRDDLSGQYKTLLRLKRYTDLSQDKSYTYGPKWDKQKLEKEPEIEERDERDSRKKDQDMDI